jgi:hypothetical protein
MTTPTLITAREDLDQAVATLLEAATAATAEDAMVRRAMAEGQQMERQRWRTLLLARIDALPLHSVARRELVVLLQGEW